jgi:hypothetical protein
MFAAGTVIGAENEGLKYDQSLWTGSGLKVEQELARREATRWDQMTLGQRAIEWSKYVVACAPGRHPPTRLLAGRADPSSHHLRHAGTTGPLSSVSDGQVRSSDLSVCCSCSDEC